MSGIVVRIETTQSQVALMNLTKGFDALEQEVLVTSKRFDAFSLVAKRAVDPKPVSSFTTTVQGV